MAKRSFTYRFKISATNEGYERSQAARYWRDDEIIHTFHEEVHNILECNKGTFVITREDMSNLDVFNLKKNMDVLCYKLRIHVKHYLNECGVDNQDTCIVEYELIRKNIFSKNDYISDKFREEVNFLVNAIKAIGDNTLINPIEQIKEMRFEIPFNYVSSELFNILKVRTTSDSKENARKYVKMFITAFFLLIPKNVIEKYDTLCEEREKEYARNAARKKENREIRPSSCESKKEDRAALHYVGQLIKGNLAREIDIIIHHAYNGQSFCFESFANWKKAIINFLEIDEVLTLYEDSKDPSDILNEISNEGHINDVKRFLSIIDNGYHIRERGKVEASAIFYTFLTVCPSKYLNDKYKRRNPSTSRGEEFNRKEFKDLCLHYFGLKPNSIKPKDCREVLKTKLISGKQTVVWDKIKPQKKD